MSISPQIKERIKSQNERLDRIEKILTDLMPLETTAETSVVEAN